jgi:uncharacterized protein YaaN involved in tellurite resistance
METQVQQEEDFVLEPPAALKLPTPAQAQKALAPLAAEQKVEVDAKVAARVENFVSRVSAADLQSDEFRNMLDRAFAAGRKEITETSKFIAGNPFLSQAKFKDYDDTEGAKALREMSTLMAKANPKGQDLLGPVTVLGFKIPYGSKLRAYLDDYEPMGVRINKLMEVVEDEEDAQRKEISGYDVVEGQLYEKLQKLDRATEYLTLLDKRLDAESAALMDSNAEKAKALREEVLFYVRNNLSDVISHKLLVVAGIGQIRQLRHTGRMTLHGMQRIRTLGMDALAIAQSVAVAAYNQKKRMDLNRQAQKVVNDVVAGLGDTIEEHTKRVVEFAQNPVLGIQSLEHSIDKTLNAINLFNNFRSTAVDTLATDNQKLTSLFEKAKEGMRIAQKPVSADYGDVFSI